MKVYDLPGAATPEGVKLEFYRTCVNLDDFRLGEEYPDLPCVVDLGRLGLAKIDMGKNEKIHDVILAEGSMVEAPRVSVDIKIYPHGVGNRILSLFNKDLPENIRKAAVTVRSPRVL